MSDNQSKLPEYVGKKIVEALKQENNETDILDWEREIDDIYEKGALELSFDKRKKLYDKYQEIIAYENPMLYLYAPLNIYAIRNKIKNVYPSKFGGLIHNLAEIYID